MFGCSSRETEVGGVVVVVVVRSLDRGRDGVVPRRADRSLGGERRVGTIFLFLFFFCFVWRWVGEDHRTADWSLK